MNQHLVFNENIKSYDLNNISKNDYTNSTAPILDVTLLRWQKQIFFFNRGISKFILILNLNQSYSIKINFNFA